ncbi:MAG TPA: hypothetical protein VE134_01280, partial [Methanomicrobiales archaeon]|nr:hypothetical protein [Methanomicrobiales archaeon]
MGVVYRRESSDNYVPAVNGAIMIERAYAALAGQLLVLTHKSGEWTLESHLTEHRPMCVTVDPTTSRDAYCGTYDSGLWRSTDGGKSWNRVGGSELPNRVMSVMVDSRRSENGQHPVWIGTEPSAVFQSNDGGDTWIEHTGIQQLPSEPDWAFPPRPETHHVRWLEPDPANSEGVYVSIEQGALIKTPDYGDTWHDRVPGSPRDVHTFAF